MEKKKVVVIYQNGIEFIDLRGNKFHLDVSGFKDSKDKKVSLIDSLSKINEARKTIYKYFCKMGNDNAKQMTEETVKLLWDYRSYPPRENNSITIKDSNGDIKFQDNNTSDIIGWVELDIDTMDEKEIGALYNFVNREEKATATKESPTTLKEVEGVYDNFIESMIDHVCENIEHKFFEYLLGKPHSKPSGVLDKISPL